jgi:hypothetical protein
MNPLNLGESTDSINKLTEDLQKGNYGKIIKSPKFQKVFLFPFKVCLFLICLCLYLVLFVITMIFLRSAGRCHQISSKVFLPKHR